MSQKVHPVLHFNKCKRAKIYATNSNHRTNNCIKFACYFSLFVLNSICSGYNIYLISYLVFIGVDNVVGIWRSWDFVMISSGSC